MGHFPHARPPDPASYAAGLAELFEHYPIGIVEGCCDVWDGIASSSNFLPAPAEVKRWCDIHLGACQNIIRKGVPVVEKQFSEEHCATMRERLQNLMHGLFPKIPPAERQKAKSDLKKMIGEEAFNALPEAAE